MIYLDSNVWIYALMATQENSKRLRALNLIESEASVVSMQVLNEVCRVLSKKGKVSEPRLRSVIRGFYEHYSIQQLGSEDVTKASELRERYHLSFWDGLHVAAALKAGATTFYSEDMHDGLVVEEVLTIINPFK
ncbi:MAG TPA: PIN domain-containing protein [Candidatus Kapabacteria bacterium]|nr:PIN domain-containing protein [Candidatus Kapabacteria bacterium]